MKLTNQNILSIRLPSHFFYQSCMTKGQTNILLTYLLKKRKKKRILCRIACIRQTI